MTVLNGDRPRLFSTSSRPHTAIAEELAVQIKGLIYAYSGQIPLALAVGVLRIVEKEILDEQQ